MLEVVKNIVFFAAYTERNTVRCSQNHEIVLTIRSLCVIRYSFGMNKNAHFSLIFLLIIRYLLLLTKNA